MDAIYIYGLEFDENTKTINKDEYNSREIRERPNSDRKLKNVLYISRGHHGPLA